MALTQRLEFRQSQSLVMTPQLMQAIKLLQLSNLDLSAFVEEELERNPLLERASEGADPPVAGEPVADRGGRGRPAIARCRRRSRSRVRHAASCRSAPIWQPRPGPHGPQLYVDFLRYVADQIIVPVARKYDGSMAFFHESAAGFGADDTHASGNQNLHDFRTPFPNSMRLQMADIIDASPRPP